MSEEIKSKIVVLLPHERGTPEFENAMETLKEWSADNYNTYKFIICETCEICGAMNETVIETKLPDGKKYLCDYCLRGLEQ